MFLKQLFLGVFGFCGGTLAAGGVFTALVAIGLIPRFAGKTHTGEKVFLYEEMVVFGTIVGGIFSLFDALLKKPIASLKNMIDAPTFFMLLGWSILFFFGMFAGIFIGCLALAIAEMLNSIPIFTRRLGFRHGLGIVILAMALGKSVGSLLYFFKQIFEYGGL